MALYDLIMDLFSFIATTANSFWEFLTKPVHEIIYNWGLPVWLKTLLAGPLALLDYIFGETGTILSIIPALIGLLLLFRLIYIIFGK